MAVPSLKTLKVACAVSACFFTAIAAGDAGAEVLRVGTESAYAPFEFVRDGKLTGFDIELTEEAAKRAGYEVEWVQMSFDGLIPALLTGQLNLAVASFTVTEDRAKKVDFSDPYYRSGLTFMVRREDLAKYPDAASISGKRICAQLGSVSAARAETISKGNVATFNDAAGAYMELIAGGCEAVLNDRPVNGYFLKVSNKGDRLAETGEVLDAEDMAMVFPKGSDEVKGKMNEAMREMRADGSFDKLYGKWFGGDED